MGAAGCARIGAACSVPSRRWAKAAWRRPRGGSIVRSRTRASPRSCRASSVWPGAAIRFRCRCWPPSSASWPTGLAQRATLLGGAAGRSLRPAVAAVGRRAADRRWSIRIPGFLRACRASAGGPPWTQRMEFYAADLIRGPNGHWMVLADRTARRRRHRHRAGEPPGAGPRDAGDVSRHADPHAAAVLRHLAGRAAAPGAATAPTPPSRC